jgi:hypothetical protein
MTARDDLDYEDEQHSPAVLSRCADCGVGCHSINESAYMVTNELWALAWPPEKIKPWHNMPGQQVLCIGCLESRIGRRLTAADFTQCPLNGDDGYKRSKRLRDRMRGFRYFMPKASEWQTRAILARAYAHDDGELFTLQIELANDHAVTINYHYKENEPPSASLWTGSGSHDLPPLEGKYGFRAWVAAALEFDVDAP